jgi:2-iminobutanoate/2-iminopropanoate deaminase
MAITFFKSDKVHREAVHSPKYSHACNMRIEKGGELIIIAGQVPIDNTGNVVAPGDFEKQTRKVFENLKCQLEAGGASFKDIIRLGVLLTDQNQWKQFDQIRSDYLREPFPVTTGFVVKTLFNPKWMLEIEAMAFIEN